MFWKILSGCNIQDHLCMGRPSHIHFKAECMSRIKPWIWTLLCQWITGFTTNQLLNHSVSSLRDATFPSLHLSLLNKECSGQPPLACVVLFHFPLCLCFQGPEAKPGVQATPDKAVTGSLGHSGLAPILWPHFQFLITYLWARSWFHVDLAWFLSSWG